MSKIPVSVRICAISQIRDFLIPSNMKVKDVIQLMLTILVSEYGISNNASHLDLVDESDGKALKLDCSFLQLGIASGAKLILI